MSGSILDNLNPNLGQRINLNDGRPSSIHGFEVFVHQSESSKLGTESSPKIRVNTLIGQNWQHSGYYGSMIACSNDYLAYVLESRSGYVVRVIQLKTKDRSLLKKFVGKICDLSFVHANSNVLGIVDQAGNLHVYDLDNANGDVSMITNDCLKLKVYGDPQPDQHQHRLVWCPFVHEEDTTDSLIVAISNGSRAEVYDVNDIVSEYAIGLVDKTKLKIGRVFIDNAHDGDICDMALSPDGNVLATGGQDGHVKFWQLDFEEHAKEPTRLHDYIPHGGSPVTRLLFCDDHFTKDPKKQFWRFLLTAAEGSTIVKVWCTVNWKCLQTVNFLPPIEGSYSPSKMILSLDLSASYLLVADATSMVLYILPLYQESNIGDASFTSITEYLLTQPILSYVITRHTPVPLVPFDSSDDDDDDDGKVEVFNPRRNAVVLRMHCIQTKSLQELQVRFEPPGIMGIPPPLSSSTNVVEQTDRPHDGYIPSNILPVVDTSHMPMLLRSSSEDTLNDIPKLKNLHISEDAKIHQYAPGQSSPSVKLLSPETILCHSTSSPTSTSASLSFQSTHILRSPSDFESLPTTVCLQPTDTHTDKSENGDKNGYTNSQIVTLPLKRYSSTDDEANEEMVVTSPNNSLPSDINNKMGPFPSAHDSSVTLLDKMNSSKMAPLTDEDEDWPELSTEESERKSEIESQLAEQEGTPLLMNDTPILVNDTPILVNDTPLLINANEASNGVFEKGAKETASLVVALAINTAVGIVEGTVDNVPTQKEEEISEEEVRSKVTHVPPFDLQNDIITASADELNVTETGLLSNEQYYNTPTVQHNATGTSSGGSTQTATLVDNDILESLVKTVQQQQIELYALRNQSQQAIEGIHATQKSIEEFSKDQRSFISSELQDHYQRLEQLIKDKPSIEPKKLTQSLTHTVTSCVNSQVEKCVKNEFKRTVPPVLQRQMMTVVDQSMQVMQQKLAQTDDIIREVLEKAINTQDLIDAISIKIASTLHQMIQKNTEALFINAVLPSFQHSLKEIFVQINEAFKTGMAEYLSQLQHHQAGLQDNALHSLHSSLVAPNSPLVQTISTTLSHDLAALTHQLEQSLSESISAVVKTGIKEIIAACSITDHQLIKQQKDRIQTLLDNKQFDEAFNFALSTSNLELVTQTCQMVGADEVFDGNGECSLTQPVLLSLIQQLAVGLQEEIDLKIKYLEMAILSLDPDDPITSPHLPPVMQLLHEQIRKVEEQLQNSRTGTPGLFRAAKRVRMLADHVKKSTQKK